MKGWRTLIINAAVAVLGIATAFDWTSVVSQQTAGIIIAAVGFVNMGLRAITHTPVASKE